MPFKRLEWDEPEAGAPAPGPWGDAEPRETWYRPQSVARLYLVTLVTFGQGLCTWAGTLAEDLRRNRVAPFRPSDVRHFLPIPVLGWRLLYDLALAVTAVAEDASGGGKRFALLVAAAGGAVMSLYVGAGLVTLSLIVLGVPSWYVAALLTVGALPVLPLPFMALQARLNRFKARLDAPKWEPVPNPTVLDFAPLGVFAAVAMVWVLPPYLQRICLPIASPDVAAESGDRQALAAAVPVRGASGLYSLTPPDGDWAQVDPDSFRDGSDLSLSGPGRGTQLLVWIACDGESIEDRVAFRRGKHTKVDRTAWIEERRELLERPFVPVSYARYRWLSDGRPLMHFIATVAHGDVLVEVIGQTSLVSRAGQSLEALVRSLKVEEEATECRES